MIEFKKSYGKTKDGNYLFPFLTFVFSKGKFGITLFGFMMIVTIKK